MKIKFLASLMLVVLFFSSVHPAISGEIAAEDRGAVTLNEPVVIYGERIKPLVVPWYKKPLVWIIVAGVLVWIILAADEDEAPTSPGSLIVTGPPL